MTSSDSLERPPSVDKILSSDAASHLIERYGRSSVTQVLRAILESLRQAYKADKNSLPSMDTLIQDLELRLEEHAGFSLKRILNLSGTVLHTNLGRALLPQDVLNTVVEVASNATNLEYDLDSGKRGDRDTHIESLICNLTGAEAATVVNNNAAAVLLVLNTLGHSKEVPVSRGELVEIGGSFRIPEIMSRSGCTLVEVGATNRTHLKDYRDAISANTALLMKVHTSNYEIRGFTNEVSPPEVANLAHDNNLPFVNDLGSGSLIDLTKFGLPDEPTVSSAIKAGADVVTFSGDKLLGGPQAGIIVGTRQLIQEIKANPMKRALRVDKMTIAALFEILKLYEDPDRLAQHLPTLRFLTRPLEALNTLANNLLDPLSSTLGNYAEVSIVDVESQIGSGSLPLERLQSKAICIKAKSDSALRALAASFRGLPLPVIGRIHDGTLLFDLRTMEDTAEFIDQLNHLDLSESTS
ncbi:MAG TPA: L-seryl-tRNA(Sec) selenium transferase [Gammaproteobacteria bacterium]|nr:L-seryl-tRNA(Sec) selenium transferase [Gammaproteobacteria bacterium]